LCESFALLSLPFGLKIIKDALFLFAATYLASIVPTKKHQKQVGPILLIINRLSP